MNYPVKISEPLESIIYIIRSQRVMLDADLALLYGTSTGRLNEAVRRNASRFPQDFMFKLSIQEWHSLISQIAISKIRGGRRHAPYVFTEQGVAMLSSILKSSRAIAVNIEIMRAFIRLRRSLAVDFEMSKELSELKSYLLKHSLKSDQEFKRIWVAIDKLSAPVIDDGENGRSIGFAID